MLLVMLWPRRQGCPPGATKAPSAALHALAGVWQQHGAAADQVSMSWCSLKQQALRCCGAQHVEHCFNKKHCKAPYAQHMMLPFHLLEPLGPVV